MLLIKLLGIFLLALGTPSVLLAQLGPDLSFLETQSKLGAPIVAGTPLVMDPAVLVSLQWSDVRYVLPVKHQEMEIREQFQDAQWIQYSRRRYEYGLGLALTMAQGTTLGLVPYKGALNSYVQTMREKDEQLKLLSLPFSLRDLRSWRVGDYGSFQTYGGILVQLSYSPFIATRAGSAAYTLQNQFVVEVRKLSEGSVILSVSEENVHHRKLLLGPAVAYSSLSSYHGLRLSMNFRLNLDDEKHHELFSRALGGDLRSLQEELPTNAQEVRWRGLERNSYFGIPWVAGRAHSAGKYQLLVNDVSQELRIRESSNRGMLLPLRTHQQIQLTSAEDIHLIWFSEMKRLKPRTLEKNFLRIGRILGVKGFAEADVQVVIPGSVISQLSISFQRSELRETLNMATLSDELRRRCVDLQLPCQKRGRVGKLVKKLTTLLALSWDEGRQKLATFLLQEPPLIYALIRASGSTKEAYFKFLSESHQSLEGWAEAGQ